MIISRTPFRISFVGGGTDLKEFYRTEPGAVLCSSIDKYIYQSMHDYFYPNNYLIKYSNTELTTSIDQIKHGIIREVFRKYSILDTDFNSTADIPAGTGMGSSSAFTCGLIKLCSSLKGLDLPNHEIANLACQIEIDILNEPIGKQDQYGCCLGGLNYIQFNPDETVDVKPLFLDYSNLKKLENNLILFYTGGVRKASSILENQKNRTLTNVKTKNNLTLMSKMATNLYNDLKHGNIDLMGDYLNEGWCLKKELASNITNNEFDDIYQIALKNGATGGKLLGAGGGGFFLFYAPKNKHEQLKKALNKLREFPFKFDFQGSSIIYKN